MAWEYCCSDTALVKGARLWVSALAANGDKFQPAGIKGCGPGGKGEPQQSGGSPVPTIPDPLKRPNAEWVNIEFQFPPKIMTDGRKGNWRENDMPGGQEQNAAFMTSGPRELSLAWTYVIDSNVDGGWNIDRITRNLRVLRGYFANARDRNAKRDNLVALLYIWCIGGQYPISSRIRSIDIKYSDTMVMPWTGSNSSGWARHNLEAHPLRTDVTVDIRIWTRGTFESNENQRGDQDIAALTPREDPTWY